MARGPTHVYLSAKPLRASLNFFLTLVCTRPKQYVPYVQLSVLHCLHFVFTLKLRTVFHIVIGTYLFLVQTVGNNNNNNNVFAIVQSTVASLLKDRTSDPWYTRPASSPFLHGTASLLHNQGPLEISREYSKLIMHGAESLKTLKRPNNKCKSRVFHPYIERSLTKFCQLFT